MIPTQARVKLDPIITKSEALQIPSTHVTECIVVEATECEEVKVGNKVLIRKTALSNFNQEDGVYMYMNESEILAIL